jgi:hypothetical protein
MIGKLQGLLAGYPVQVAGLILAVYLAVHILPGPQAHIRIHDNLDDNFVKYVLLERNDALLTLDEVWIPEMLGGIRSRRIIQPNLGTEVLFALLPPLPAYFVMLVVQRVVAFIGMLLLVRSLLPSANRGHEIIAPWAGLCFALLPFWPFGALSIAGVPWLAWCMLSVARQNKIKPVHLTPVLFIPLMGSLGQSFLFAGILFAAMIVLIAISSRRVPWSAVSLLLVFAFSASVGSYRQLLFLFWAGSEDTIRQAFDLRNDNLLSAAKRTVLNFVRGDPGHAESLHTYVVLPTLLLAGLSPLTRLRWKLYVLFGLTAIGSISLMYGVYYLAEASRLDSRIPILGQLQWSRFHWMHPVLWMALFGFGLYVLYIQSRFGKKLAIIAIAAQITLSFAASDEVVGYRNNSPSFQEFYSRELFRRLLDELPEVASGRVAAVGFHPAVTLMNGMQTLDGYLSNASLRYKTAFRPFIGPELAKSEALRIYYDDWGGRIYAFSAELYDRPPPGDRFTISQANDMAIEIYSVSPEAFEQLGGTHLISAVPIRHFEEDRFELIGSFGSVDDFYSLYVYRMK